MSEAGEKLAFVAGHYKSGSTWLVNLLSLHPEVRGVAETHVFRYTEEGADLTRATRQLFEAVAWAGGGLRGLPRHRLAKWSRPLRKGLGLARGQAALSDRERPTTALDLSEWDRRKLRRRLERCTDRDQYCRVFFGFLVERLAPGRYLLEKTPTNMPYVPRIRSLFPRARVLAVYRDGRDVVVSDSYHRARTHGKALSFEGRVRRWREAMEQQFLQEDEGGLFALSYESLLERPAEVVSRLLAHLDIPVDASVLDDMIRRSSFEFTTGRKRGEGVENAFYRKGVAGDWRNHYSDDEKRVFSELAGDLLVRLGYEQTADWKAWA